MSTTYLNMNDPNLARQRITKKQFEKLLLQVYKRVIFEKAPACCGDPATTWYYTDLVQLRCVHQKCIGVWENGHGATPYNAASVQKQIDKDPKISKKEGKLIHRLLRGWRKNNGTKISKEDT